MKQTSQIGAKRWPVLFLAASLLLLLIAMGSAQSLRAQEGDEPTPAPDGGAGVFVTSSQEDLEKLPPALRESLVKVSSFGAADSYEIGESTKVASRSMVLPGDQVTFTIVVRNSGDTDSPLITVTDELPNELSYVDHEFAIPDGGLQSGGGVSGNVVTWEGNLAAGGSVEITVVAEVKNSVAADTQVTNVAQISAGDKSAAPETTIMVVDEVSMPFVHLPMVVYGEKPLTPDIISITSSRPNSQNRWTVSWNGAGAASFELQEAHNPNFTNSKTFAVGPEASKSFDYAPSTSNVYYYRARSTAGGGVAGNWSQTVKVVGGYRDDFTDPASGWTIRRTSHLDEVKAWYEFPPNYTWHILQVNDRWDLGLTSPLMEAPSVPYAIELEVKSVHPGWQKGLGLVFASDKVSDTCPKDTNTTDGWYKHKDCFNEFYEFMLVEGADKKNLQVQRVHEVVWLGSGSGGIPVHRKVAKNWYIEKISGVSWDDYNRMRVVVRQNEIEFWAGRSDGELKLQLTIDENMYPGNPYFGTIATTQEYSNTTARYEYFEVMPLGN